MRSFVQNYVFDNALMILIDYAFLSLIIAWKAQYNTRVKSEGIKDEIMIFGWDKSTFWLHFGVPLIFMGVSVALFGADFGWFLDIFCWIGFILGFFLFISFFFIDKTYILPNEYIVVPAYGRRKDHYYSTIQKVVVKRDLTKEDEKVKDDYKINLVAGEDEHQISGETSKVQQLLMLLKEKVSLEKFEFVDEAVPTDESDEATES